MSAFQIINLVILLMFLGFVGWTLRSVWTAHSEMREHSKQAERVRKKVAAGIFDDEVVEFNARAFGMTPDQFRLMVPPELLVDSGDPSDTEHS